MKPIILVAVAFALPVLAADQVKTVNGIVEGASENGLRTFKGIPFAEPPVGDLRWKPPQPGKNWSGVKQTKQFGPRCMQLPLFGDMNFRSNGMGEDCLYLNIWTPAKSEKEKLPVLVYFFGGGFMAGDGSEPRYDGESMARKGIVAITVNQRLGIFGFFAHPDLTAESAHHASGNYALLDHTAALQWVQKNIAAFGGDPKRVTIAGESAGSVAVSAQMASPLSKDLIAGAIGESGSLLGTLAATPLADAEKSGTKFASIVSAENLAALRAIPADKLLEAAGKPGTPRFSPCIDGYFFPKDPKAIFANGEQAHVPLLVGWNSEESGARGVLGREAPTQENFKAAVQRLYPDRADDVLKAYSGDVQQAATDLASARFIGLSTWRWAEAQAKTGGKPVYRYFYARPRPAMTKEMGDAVPGLAGGVLRGEQAKANAAPPAKGAVHSAEIEYAMGNLATNKVYAWTPDDYKVSKTMQEYFANFIKTGNPSAKGLPKWPAYTDGHYVMRIDVTSEAAPEKNRERYTVLDR